MLFPRCLPIPSTTGSLNGPHSLQCNNTVVMASTVDFVVPGTGNSWNSRYMVYLKLVAHSLVFIDFLVIISFLSEGLSYSCTHTLQNYTTSNVADP